MSADPTRIRCGARGVLFDLQLDPATPPAVLAALTDLARPESRRDEPDLPTCRLSASPSEPVPSWEVSRNGDSVMSTTKVSEAFAAMMSVVTDFVVRGNDDVLSIHAACVGWREMGLLLPGRSGSGKSTLCTRLLQAGASYLTDESTGVVRDGLLLGFPKPIGLKAGTVAELDDLDVSEFELDPGAQSVWHVPAGRVTETTTDRVGPGVIAFPRFEPGAGFEAEVLPRPHAVDRLLSNAQNVGRVELVNALELAAGLVSSSTSYSVTFGDAEQAAEGLGALVDAHDGGSQQCMLVAGRADVSTSGGPASASGVVAACFDDGAVLCEPGDRLLVTNPAGSELWPLLDGTRTIDELAQLLATRYDEHPGQIGRDLDRWVSDLRARGFLESWPG